MVGVERLELSRYCYQRILSPSCLPVPTHSHKKNFNISNYKSCFSATITSLSK